MVSWDLANFKERAILDDNVIHMERLEVGEINRERYEVSGVFRLVELEKIRSVGVVIARPAEFIQSLFKV